jgi:hypothetical protein
MPIVTPGTTKPPSTQSDLGAMIGEIILWRPDIGPEMAKGFINNALRKVVDSRHWYGMLARGEAVSPNVYTTGTVTVTADSATVVGNGTAWGPEMVGRQFRIGFTQAVYTILSVDVGAQTFVMDLPWGGTTLSGTGYQIFQAYYSLGGKIKRILTMVNKQQGYCLYVNWPQELLNTIDPWRARTGWTFACADYVPSTTGEPQYELYPWPMVRQAFPYLAYSQAADLSDDNDSPPAFIRSDVLVLGALSDALRFRKGAQYYDPDTANMKERQFQLEIQKMARTDNDLLQKDTSWEYWRLPVGGPEWDQAHAVQAEEIMGSSW